MMVRNVADRSIIRHYLVGGVVGVRVDRVELWDFLENGLFDSCQKVDERLHGIAALC